MSNLKKVIGKLSLQTISENALLNEVVRELEGREAFKDADTDHNERIYHGDVFEAIASEFAEMKGTNREKSQKVIDHLDELAKLISADYLLVTI